MKKLYWSAIVRVLLYALLVLFLFIHFTFITSLFTDDRDLYNTIGLFNMQLSFLVVIILSYKLEKIKSFNLRKVNLLTIIVIIVAAGLNVFLYPIFQIRFYEDLFENVLTVSTFQIKSIGVLTFFHTVLLMPFLEEFLYRGIFIRVLSLKNNAFVSVVLPSALFSLGHMKTEQLLSAFIFGVIIGVIYYKIKNLTICVALHAASNLILYFSSDKLVTFEYQSFVLISVSIVLFFISLRFLVTSNFNRIGSFSI